MKCAQHGLKTRCSICGSPHAPRSAQVTPAQRAVILNAKGRNREEDPRGWMGTQSWRDKGYLQIAGAMLPPLWRRCKVRARPGRGRRDKPAQSNTFQPLWQQQNHAFSSDQLIFACIWFFQRSVQPCRFVCVCLKQNTDPV